MTAKEYQPHVDKKMRPLDFASGVYHPVFMSVLIVSRTRGVLATDAELPNATVCQISLVAWDGKNISLNIAGPEGEMQADAPVERLTSTSRMPQSVAWDRILKFLNGLGDVKLVIVSHEGATWQFPLVVGRLLLTMSRLGLPKDTLFCSAQHAHAVLRAVPAPLPTSIYRTKEHNRPMNESMTGYYAFEMGEERNETYSAQMHAHDTMVALMSAVARRTKFNLNAPPTATGTAAPPPPVLLDEAAKRCVFSTLVAESDFGMLVGQFNELCRSVFTPCFVTVPVTFADGALQEGELPWMTAKVVSALGGIGIFGLGITYRWGKDCDVAAVKAIAKTLAGLPGVDAFPGGLAAYYANGLALNSAKGDNAVACLAAIRAINEGVYVSHAPKAEEEKKEEEKSDGYDKVLSL